MTDSRRAIDYYLIGLVSSSTKGMLELTTGEAHARISRLHAKHPKRKMKEFVTESPHRWDGKCIICDGKICQTLYTVQSSKRRGSELVLFESARGSDGKMRVANSRNYSGKVKKYL